MKSFPVDRAGGRIGSVTAWLRGVVVGASAARYGPDYCMTGNRLFL
ncbi:hypothetical protein GCM10010378_39910 [Streptomyces viridochromogenes]